MPIGIYIWKHCYDLSKIHGIQSTMKYHSQTANNGNFVHHTNEILIQNKEHNCGIFCYMYADCISNGGKLNVSNENIQQKMAVY